MTITLSPCTFQSPPAPPQEAAPPYPTCHHCGGPMRHTLLESCCLDCGFTSGMRESGWEDERGELQEELPPVEVLPMVQQLAVTLRYTCDLTQASARDLLQVAEWFRAAEMSRPLPSWPSSVKPFEVTDHPHTHRVHSGAFLLLAWAAITSPGDKLVIQIPPRLYATNERIKASLRDQFNEALNTGKKQRSAGMSKNFAAIYGGKTEIKPKPEEHDGAPCGVHTDPLLRQMQESLEAYKRQRAGRKRLAQIKDLEVDTDQAEKYWGVMGALTEVAMEAGPIDRAAESIQRLTPEESAAWRPGHMPMAPPAESINEDDATAQVARPGCKFKVGDQVRHRRRPTIYKVLMTPDDKVRIEGTRMSAYVYTQDDGLGPLWVRPQSEMEDGRFTPVDPQSQNPPVESAEAPLAPLCFLMVITPDELRMLIKRQKEYVDAMVVVDQQQRGPGGSPEMAARARQECKRRHLRLQELERILLSPPTES